MRAIGWLTPYCPMNAFIRIVVTGTIALLASGAGQAESKVRVQGSADLRLAVVESTRGSAGTEAVQATFAACLAEAINAGGGAPIDVTVKRVSADHAAFNLGTGVYDAVLVMGNALPRPLILSGTKRLIATLSSGKGEKKAFLVFSENDAGLAKVLTAAFTPAITSTEFLDALDGGFEPVVIAKR